jgi:hypothetical protein
MVKRFTIPCDFSGQQIPVVLYIGAPHSDFHPLHFQNTWLSSVKGGKIPADVMDSIEKLRNLAKKNNVSFEELCFYAINVANGEMEDKNKKFENIISEGEKEEEEKKKKEEEYDKDDEDDYEDDEDKDEDKDENKDDYEDDENKDEDEDNYKNDEDDKDDY